MTSTKTILITGATSGIGRAAALLLARQGHHVFATGRNRAALDTLAQEAVGLQLETLRLDVTDAASIEAARRAVHLATDGQGLDVLVNNAGFGTVAPVIEVDPAELRAQFDTNVFGLIAVTQAFAEPMRRRGRGTIINVSSVGGRVTMPLLATYNATKYALESLSDGLRLELRPFGIRVCLVEPGVIATGFNGRAAAEVHDRDGSAYAPALAKMAQTMRQTDRLATGPATVARAIARAATSSRPRARYVVPRYNLLLLALAKLLPTAWVDAVMRRATGLRASELGAVGAERIESPATESAPSHAA